VLREQNSVRRTKHESADRLCGFQPALPEIFEEFMSSAVISTSAASRRPFVFDADNKAAMRRDLQSTTNHQKLKFAPSSVIPASQLEVRPAPEMVASGIPALDALTGGLPRGCLTEICGPASSGRTTVLLAALAASTRRGEFCALVDASDALDPNSAAAAGVELDRLLWVRCGNSSSQKVSSPQRHRGTEKNLFEEDSQEQTKPRSAKRETEHCLEQVLRATDLLLESGGFGLIVLDLVDLPPQAARRIPLTTWFRFRRAVENKLTILLALEQLPIAGSCSSLLLQLGGARLPGEAEAMRPQPTHAHLLRGLEINAGLICSRLERKPARFVTFATKTAWAG
jgi:recA bacterial DNA recombination protein